MIEMIREIKKMLREKEPPYRMLLASCLTLPDLCGQIEYPQKNKKNDVGERYSRWFDKYVYKEYFQTSPPSSADQEFQEVFDKIKFDGAFCYQLRCAYLHSGNLEFSKKIGILNLLMRNDPNDEYVLCYGLNPKKQPPERYVVEMDIRYLCEALAASALNYYYLKGPEFNSKFSDHGVKITSCTHTVAPTQEYLEAISKQHQSTMHSGTWLRRKNKIPLILPEQYVDANKP